MRPLRSEVVTLRGGQAIRALVRGIHGYLLRGEVDQAIEACEGYLYGKPERRKKLPQLKRKNYKPRPNVLPTHKQIVSAMRWLWQDLGIEYPEAACWCCGALRSTLVRAHIVADKHGGSSLPDNFFLLCQDCHDRQPDGADVGVQVMWLRGGGWSGDLEVDFRTASGMELGDFVKYLEGKVGTREALPTLRRVMHTAAYASAGHGPGQRSANLVAALYRYAQSVGAVPESSVQSGEGSGA